MNFNNKSVPSPVKKGCADVPVVMQMEALECGAASLAMVLAYYRKWIPLEQVRSDCGVSRDGSNAKNILRAAKNYGLNTKAMFYEIDALFNSGTYPCIIHWNFNHFVVLKGFKGKYALINDPGRGSVKIPIEEFKKSFTGVCLEFSPGENFEPGGKQKSIFSFAMKRLKGTAAAFIFVIITTVVISVTGILKPAFSQVFADRLLTGQNTQWLSAFTALLLGVTAVEFIVGCVKSLYMLKTEGKLAVVANSKYLWHVLRMPMEFFSQRMAGDIADRQTKNEGIAKDLINTLAPVFLDTAMMIFYLIIMIKYNVLLSLVGVASMLINIIVAKIVSKKRINITRVQMRDSGKLAGSTVNGIEMIETIKSSGAENGYFEKWSGYQASVNTQNEKYSKINQYIGAIPQLVSSIADIIVLMTGVFLIINGKFTVGMIMAFQGYLASFRQPAQNILETGQHIQEMRTNMERVEDIMNYAPDVDIETSEDINDSESYSKLTGNVELKNVTFGYSKLAEPLITDFNLSLKPGSRVALVGASGCGKSTIAKLVSGLYSPWSGEILFDGKPISQIDRTCFTGSLVVVDQDIILFEDTISNNIKMWDNTIEDFEMIMAARDAQIHDDIMQREGGYQYKILESGKDFSGGQRQRLEIARVLAQDPTIIIMDEATSALDAQTEYEVVKSIKQRGITCIVVAHRLSTIRDCDEIIVLDKGKVVERGTHDELYSKGGMYSQLVTNE